MPRGKAPGFDRQREAILAMAARHFAAHGYPVATTAALARACGISKPLLYHYYRDKAQLLYDIADGYLDGLQAIVAAVEAEKLPGAQRLRRLIVVFMRAYADAAAQHRVLVQDVKYLAPALRRRLAARQRRIVQAFADAVAETRPALAGTVLLKPVTMVLFGMVNWTFTWLRDDGEVSYAAVADVVADLFTHGLGALPAAVPTGTERAAKSPARPRSRGRSTPAMAAAARTQRAAASVHTRSRRNDSGLV